MSEYDSGHGWPALPSGSVNELVGYGRVFTSRQQSEQQDALEVAGCGRVFVDLVSTGDARRPELAACLEYLRPQDILVTTDLPRLGNSLNDLIRIVGDLRAREVGLRSLKEEIDTSTPGGRFFFHIFASLAEFAREVVAERTRVGLDAARSRAQRLGRPPALSADQVQQARLLLARPDESVSSIARLLGVSRTTLYKYVPELGPSAGGRKALAENARNVVDSPSGSDAEPNP